MTKIEEQNPWAVILALKELPWFAKRIGDVDEFAKDIAIRQIKRLIGD